MARSTPQAGPYQGQTVAGRPQERRGGPGGRRPGRGDRRPRDRPGPFRPQQDADRAVPGGPVVRADGGTRRVGHGRGPRRAGPRGPAAVRQGLSRLAVGKTRLAGQPAVVVGAPHSDLVARVSPAAATCEPTRSNSSAIPELQAGRVAFQRGSGRGRSACRQHDGGRLRTLHLCLRDDADELAARFEQDGFRPGRGRAGHLVQLGPVASLHARLARRRHPQLEVLLSDQRADHEPRHHHAVGRPHGPDRTQQHGRGPVPGRVHPSQDPRRLRRDACRSRRATASTRST